MNTTTLFIEFIIIGFVTFISLILGLDSFHHIDFLSYKELFKDYKELIALICLAAFYILGIIIYRIIELLPIHFFDFLTFWMKKTKTKRQKDWKFWDERYFVLQFGSEKVIQRVNYHETFLRLFKSFFVLLPFFGFLSKKYIYDDISCFYLIIILVFSYLSLLAYRIQENNYTFLINNAAKTIKNYKEFYVSKS